MKAVQAGAPALVTAIGLLLAWPLSAPAEEKTDESVVQEVLGILKERGIVDQEEYERLSLKSASWEKERAPSLLSKIEWFGDLRLRQENFWYETPDCSGTPADCDPVESDSPDRARFRYRLRVGALVPINETVTAGFRLSSSESSSDIRSTNQSAGRSNPDFNYDDIFINWAYLDFAAPKQWLGEDASLHLVGGKMENPFLWKNGKDYLLWDPDITPEGGAIVFRVKPTERWSFFANAGYFVDQENSTSTDPHVLGLQGGFAVTPAEAVELGGRVSWYSWDSLNQAFFDRGESFGNLPGGLGDPFEVGELATYVRYTGFEAWPILVFGHFARNFEAEDTPGGGKEDTGWGVGVEVGDKKKLVALGAGYYWEEANFAPAQFTDSDLFDGFTNRKGWTVYGTRQLFPNTDLVLTLFGSDVIEDDVPPFADSVEDSDRYRLQADILVKF
jgi:hypothetical protein